MKLFDARTSVRFVERQFNYMYLNQDKRSYQNCLKGNTNQLNETCRKKKFKLFRCEYILLLQNNCYVLFDYTSSRKSRH